MPDYADFLARSAAGASLVVASHPYCLPALRDARGALPLVYEAHNVEAHLKEATLGGDLARVARDVEAEACDLARLVLACSAEDGAELSRLYGVDAARLHVAPNGVDTAAIAMTDGAARAARRCAIGLEDARIALFVGSRHPPNIEAAEAIIGLAPALPDVTFLLVGGQCEALAARPRPRNVALMGVVDAATLATITAVADVALNPMRTGSGTNLKIGGYLAAGMPVVTTPIGARGYALVDGEHAVVCALGEFGPRIRALLDDAALAERLAARGRLLAETRYDWGVIATGVVAALEAVLADTERPGGADRPAAEPSRPRAAAGAEARQERAEGDLRREAPRRHGGGGRRQRAPAGVVGQQRQDGGRETPPRPPRRAPRRPSRRAADAATPRAPVRERLRHLDRLPRPARDGVEHDARRRVSARRDATTPRSRDAGRQRRELLGDRPATAARSGASRGERRPHPIDEPRGPAR